MFFSHHQTQVQGNKNGKKKKKKKKMFRTFWVIMGVSIVNLIDALINLFNISETLY